jgi:3-oxoacyl-[acyl-carrier-protein] synthase-3
LLGIGAYRPPTVVTNDDLAQLVETSDDWVRQRTGIATRRVSSDTVIEMGAIAGMRALESADLDPDEVDLVLLASCSMPTPIPGGAASVATSVGIRHAGAADVNAACAGFCYALSWAADAIRSGSARNVLVVASERLSYWVDWTDRTTCVIFGDGAGAVVVGTSGEERIGPVVWGSDGALNWALAVSDEERQLRMDGPAVFRWATTDMVQVAKNACASAQIDVAELAAFIPHQANLRIVDSLARKLGISADRVAHDVIEMGNTSSASIPLALERLISERRLESGDPVLLLGFGAGLTYAAQVVACP